MENFMTISIPRGSHWMRYRVIFEFVGFPNDIANVIVDYLQLLKLRDWIDEIKIRNERDLLTNPDALAADMLPDVSIFKVGNIEILYIVENPDAINYIKQHPDIFIGLIDKWYNPKIVEWLIPLGIHPETTREISMARCDLAINTVIEMNHGDVNKSTYDLSGNPLAINLINENLSAIDRDRIWCNPAAVNILIDMIASGNEINWRYLSLNDSEWAMVTLCENINKIDYGMLARNTKIFEPVPNPNKKELLSILTAADLK
jgi:hypothetical protein